MKEAIGGIPIFQIVVLFLLLFTGIMCLTINHSKAFGVKDEIITIIQSDTVNSSKKLSTDTIENIVEQLKNAGYRTTGSCPDAGEDGNEWIGYSKDGDEGNNDNAAFCIRANDVTKSYENDTKEKCKGGKCTTTSGDYPLMIYYDIILFYQLDIPLLNDVMNFQVKGSTKVLYG